MKTGYAVLAGRPNVGKSTLMNRLIGQKIAITSKRPQTTRNRIETVYTDERGQIIFLDTPGVHKAENALGEYMDKEAERAFFEADVICFIAEPVTYIGKGELFIASLIEKAQKKGAGLILVINKADTLKEKEDINGVIKAYGKILRFDAVAVLSALCGTACDSLLDDIFMLLPEGPRYFDEDTVTTVPLREICRELIREQALTLLSDEIPHGIAVDIQKFSRRRKGLYDIEADIICERESHKGIIIGKGGDMLKRIGSGARAEMEMQLDEQVNLKLFVKVRKNWRNNESYIKSYGYK